MVAVKFQYADGRTIESDLAEGDNLMETAVRNGIDGIDADCGGALSCATCHVQLDPEWLDKVAPPTSDETEMLEFAVEPTERSRLSCQIVITPALEGMLVHIPENQR